jgi:hypothetical protein
MMSVLFRLMIVVALIYGCCEYGTRDNDPSDGTLEGHDVERMAQRLCAGLPHDEPCILQRDKDPVEIWRWNGSEWAVSSQP